MKKKHIVSILLLVTLLIGCTAASIVTENLAPSDMLQIFLGYLKFFGVGSDQIKTNITLEENIPVDIFIPTLDLAILLPLQGVENDTRAEQLQATKKYSVMIWWEPEEWADEQTGRALRQFRINKPEDRVVPGESEEKTEE